MFGLISTVVLLVIGFFAGRYLEKKHFISIKEREKKLIHIPTTNFKRPINKDVAILESKLAVGSVVVSTDYFKTLLALLRNIFGGNIASYETLIDRGRREAVLRMKEQFPDSDSFINLRIETSSISKGRKQTTVTVEILATATALKYV